VVVREKGLIIDHFYDSSDDVHLYDSDEKGVVNSQLQSFHCSFNSHKKGMAKPVPFAISRLL